MDSGERDDGFEFDVFLSHSSADKELVEPIAEQLRDVYELKVWLDSWRMIPGDELVHELERGLDASRCVVVLQGPQAQGPWQRQEVQAGINEAVRQDRRVIPVLLPGARADQLSAFLKLRLFVDLNRERLDRLVLGIRGELPGVEAPAKPADGFVEPLPKTELDAYRRRLEVRHEHLDALGFDDEPLLRFEPGELPVTLDADVDLRNRGKELVSDSEPLSLVTAFEFARARRRRGLVLRGAPGSGKTTFLKQAMFRVLRKGPEEIGLPRHTLPVFLRLRELRDASATLGDVIEAQLGDPASEGFGQRLAGRRKLLLLLDGLDEVASAEERKNVTRWVKRVSQDYPDAHLLVSCRHAGYTTQLRSILGATFVELNLRPLEDEQMRDFVRHWFEVAERELGPWEQSARERADALIERLMQPEFTVEGRVYEMTRNPLLLTGICLIHEAGQELPHARAALYDQCVRALIGRGERRWHESESIPITGAKTRALARALAGWMHGENSRRRATAEELREPAGRALAKQGVELEPRRGLHVLCHAGLLEAFEGDAAFAFTHLGFQEFLAAQQLRERVRDEPARLGELAERFDDSWWKEVILLLLALDDEEQALFDDFMRALVERPGFVDWSRGDTMGLCLTEASAASGAAFEELLERRPRLNTPGGLRGWWTRLTRKEALEAELAELWEALGERQVAAAELLARVEPRALERLSPTLREHPAAAVREWWRGRSRPDAKDVRIVEGVELVRIPAGAFVMGSPSDNEQGGDGERPQHEVALVEFYLAKTPVTNAQYGRYLEANPEAPKPKYWGDRKWNQPQQPVVGVSWEEAEAYCEWAGLVLPTEAQWEYACRAGTTTRYWAGDEEGHLARVGWYRENSGGRTHPVGEKEANAWGLHDVHGNVFEWCLDGLGDYETKPQPGDGLRHKPEGDAIRVFRGGCWNDPARFARSAYPLGWHPSYRSRYVGFRPALRP